MKINSKYIKMNYSKGRAGNKVKYIVIHDTGNTGKTANANAHFNYFNSGNRRASAHYFVDESQVLQIIRDEDTAWHVGDGKGKYGITNQNSIGIEICINDGNYTKEVEMTRELTLYLMNKYNVPLERVVRHYDASRKNCPRTMNNGNWKKWYEFKDSLVNHGIQKESITDIAKKVMLGRYGNGADRKLKLEAEGYNYNEVQNEVNRLQGVSKEKEVTSKLVNSVINGDYGNGNARKLKLEAEGYNYESVRKEVNKRYK